VARLFVTGDGGTSACVGGGSPGRAKRRLKSRPAADARINMDGWMDEYKDAGAVTCTYMSIDGEVTWAGETPTEVAYPYMSIGRRGGTWAGETPTEVTNTCMPIEGGGSPGRAKLRLKWARLRWRQIIHT